MLNILFVPGSFGTTIQVLVYRFSLHYVQHTATHIDPCDVLASDGSMHNHLSTGHTYNKSIISNFFDGQYDDAVNNSNLIPYAELGVDRSYDYKWLLDGFLKFRKQDQTIFVQLLTERQAELSLLFQYNKKETARIHGYSNSSNMELLDVLEMWGIDVTEHQESELLDIFSDYYPSMINKWLDSNTYTDDSWLKLNIDDMLDSTYSEFKRIINFAGGIYDPEQEEILHRFASEWRQKQQYVLDQYALINDIVEEILAGKLEYKPNMNFMAEAIILKKLKSRGYIFK